MNGFIGSQHGTSIPNVEQWAYEGFATIADTWDEGINNFIPWQVVPQRFGIFDMEKLIWEHVLENLEPWEELMTPPRDILCGGEWANFS